MGLWVYQRLTHRKIQWTNSNLWWLQPFEKSVTSNSRLDEEIEDDGIHIPDIPASAASDIRPVGKWNDRISLSGLYSKNGVLLWQTVKLEGHKSPATIAVTKIHVMLARGTKHGDSWKHFRSSFANTYVYTLVGFCQLRVPSITRWWKKLHREYRH